MSFEFPERLWLLGCVIILGLLFLWKQRTYQKKLASFGHQKLMEELLVGKPVRKPFLKTALQLLALSSLIIAWANPRMGIEDQEVEQKGTDICIALDLSNSMYTQDVKPDRLQRAKLFIKEFSKQLQNDRVALVVFAGTSYVQMPLTTDYSAVDIFISSVTPELISMQGTSISAAIEAATFVFEKADKGPKNLVIISDGETFDDNAEKSTKKAVSDNIRIFTVGIGTTEGGKIPIYGDGGIELGYKTEPSGKPVISKFEPKNLQQIATIGKGDFFRVEDQYSAKQLYKAIQQGGSKKYGEKLYANYNSQYIYFVVFALLLLAVDFFLTSARSERWSKLNIFKHSAK